MYILGIESSCDDTSVAIVDASENGIVVIAEKTASQIDVHKKYGGVVPEIAGRKHAEFMLPVIEEVVGSWRLATCLSDRQADGAMCVPDVIAVTAGPGLMTGLLVGTEAAKALSYLWNIPLIPVNHIEGHIHSILISDVRLHTSDFERLYTNHNLQPACRQGRSAICNLQFPAVALVVSGGHTELILMRDFGEYDLIGKTRDDAAGECFDKVAKLLGFDYPGGPKISAHAEHGDPSAITFPRPMIDSSNFDFSFSGLKTAALYWLRDYGGLRTCLSGRQATDYGLQTPILNDFCASFEQAIVDVLLAKTISAAKKYGAQSVILAGGVSANKKLRETLDHAIQTLETPITYHLSPKTYAMDNAAMIAAAAYRKAQKKEFTPWHALEVNPNWKIYG